MTDRQTDRPAREFNAQFKNSYRLAKLSLFVQRQKVQSEKKIKNKINAMTMHRNLRPS